VPHEQQIGVKMKKTLIAYASKSGATEQAAKIVADVLKDKHGLEVELVNLRKESADLAQYHNVVVGAGVRAGKVYSEALGFLKQDFGNRKLAFFVCCGAGGDPNKREEACSKYITKVLADYPNLKAVATEAFGGRMKMLGKTLFDNIDPDKIRAWAETLGSKLAE
jgi:menaquinone-dependent protoporphyrinogen oxidase